MKNNLARILDYYYDILKLGSRQSGLFNIDDKYSVVKHLPVMMISAMTHQEDKNKAFKAGADEFMGKPFNSKVLVERIRTLMDKKQ